MNMHLATSHHWQLSSHPLTTSGPLSCVVKGITIWVVTMAHMLVGLVQTDQTKIPLSLFITTIGHFKVKTTVNTCQKKLLKYTCCVATFQVPMWEWLSGCTMVSDNISLTCSIMSLPAPAGIQGTDQPPPTESFPWSWSWPWPWPWWHRHRCSCTIQDMMGYYQRPQYLCTYRLPSHLV